MALSAPERVYYVTRFIPQGKVLTYKILGQLALVSNPRIVGSILHRNPDGDQTPCHRIINSQGKVAVTYAFGGGDVQEQLLKQEGVVFNRHRADLAQSLWQASALFQLYFQLVFEFEDRATLSKIKPSSGSVNLIKDFFSHHHIIVPKNTNLEAYVLQSLENQQTLVSHFYWLVDQWSKKNSKRQ